jgi:hypothetical protein
MDGPFLHGLIDGLEELGKHFLGVLFVLLLDEGPDFLHLGTEKGCIPLVDRGPPQAATMLPDRGLMMGHGVLLKGRIIIE